ncbi:RraA family protein, partial [Proteus mirabilis]|nr:RraA family protein [Proteus mirabilis]
RAMPVLEADFFAVADEGGHAQISRKPFGLMFHALDSLKPDEIYVCSGASPRYAVWGELMSTRALQLKAAGAICDGYCRDSRGILDL